MAVRPGVFIVVDGPDGAGKTTLVARLAERLRGRGRGRDVLEVRQPGGTPVAEAARRIVLDPALDASPMAELFLMLAARADQVAKVIRPALEKQLIVLSDRYELATEAYQIVGRGLPRERVLEANAMATDGLEPDLTIVLDVPAALGRRRQAQQSKHPDRIEREGEDWHRRIAAVFADATGPNIVHIDGTLTPEEVEKVAWSVLLERLDAGVDQEAESRGL